MKAYDVIYQNGHFIDRVSGQRIHPVQGARYIINGAESAFALEDEKMLKNFEVLSSEEKLKALQKKWHNRQLVRIGNANTLLAFRIGLDVKTSGDHGQGYIFTCTLLEDLYIYSKQNSIGKEDDWRLADCICRLEECIAGGKLIPEKIVANSLGKLFAKTVSHYFSGKRSTSTNVFHTFFEYKPGDTVSFDSASGRCKPGPGSWRFQAHHRLTHKPANPSELPFAG